jgi:RsiW-degrading membrane proteinase PrsW (M82 family)
MNDGKITLHLHKPDASEMIFFFLCGVVISVPLTLFIYQYTDALLVGLNPFTIALMSQVLIAPFIEEFSKAYPIFYRHGETQRSLFKLAVLVGLGFGLVEMLIYVTVLGVNLGYRVPGLFFHPASTSLTAYGISVKQPFPYYIMAVFLHLANNYFALTSPIALLPSIVIVTITVFASWQLYNKTKEKIVV